MENTKAREEVKSEIDKETIKKVEAALFLAARWLSLDELVKLTGINPLTLKEVLSLLEEKYKSDESAIVILKSVVDGIESWKMDVKKQYAYLVNKIATGQTEFTKAEQETLAIIAYKQPIKQSVVVKIRGNKAYDHIKHFIQAGLVKARKLGKTFELTLTKNFYDYFNLK